MSLLCQSLLVCNRINLCNNIEEHVTFPTKYSLNVWHNKNRHNKFYFHEKERKLQKKKKKILVLSVSNLYVWICLILLACQWIMLDPNCRSGEVIVKILVINRKWRVVYIINITYTLQFIIILKRVKSSLLTVITALIYGLVCHCNKFWQIQYVIIGQLFCSDHYSFHFIVTLARFSNFFQWW